MTITPVNPTITSPAGRPHVSGVLYDEVDGALWVHTMRTSRKARSIATNPHVAVTIPFRELPVRTPYTIHLDDEEGRR